MASSRSNVVGREQELARLRAMLEDPSIRWITVAGLGGVGKSTLANECLEAGPERPVVFCRLDDVGPGNLIVAVSRALGVEGTADALRAALSGDGPRLLVLDGAEVLTDDETRALSGWLERTPQLRLLVTSRRRLREPGEHVLRLEPLPLPPVGASREEVLASPAVELLADRMRRIDDAATAAIEPEGIGALARALDGLPLGLELCAPTAVLLGTEATRARLEQVVAVTAPGASPEDRRASLERVLETTWTECPEWVRAGLAQAAVFAGSFTLEAVEAVVQLPAGHTGLELLQELLDRSLLQVDGTGPPEGARTFRLHDLVRRYARERLDSAEAVRRRHEEHYLGGLAATHGRSTSPVAVAEEHLGASGGNILAACARVRSDEAACPERLARVAIAARALFRRGIRLPDLDRLIERVVEPAVMNALGPAGASTIAELVGVVRGWDQVEGAGEWLQRARSLAEQTGDADRRFGAHLQLVHQHLEMTEMDEARAALGEMRALLPQLPGERWRAWVVAMGALIEREAADGRWLEAQLVEAERLFRAAGAWKGSRAWVAARTAEIVLDDGRPEAALEHARAAQELAEDNAPLRMFAGSIESMSLAAMGDLPAAEGVAERLAEEAADDAAARLAYLARAVVRLQRQDWADAALAFQAILGLPVDTEERASEAVIHLGLAVACAREGSGDRARRALDQARALCGELPVTDPVRALCERIQAALDGSPLGEMPTIRPSSVPILPAMVRLIAGAVGEVSPPTLTLGLDAAWVSLSGGERIPLTRRPVIQRILKALADRHQREAGAALTTDELFDHGWPGERIDVGSARNRVRVALTRLRRLGLHPVIERIPEGVRIRPGVVVEQPSEG